MSNYQISVKLNKLKGACVKELQGKTAKKKCIIIPIEDNDMFISDSNDVILNLAGWESNKLNHGNTHLIKWSPSKKTSEKMTDEQKRAIPILGNLKPFGTQTTAKPVSEKPKDEFSDILNNDDDLPF